VFPLADARRCPPPGALLPLPVNDPGGFARRTERGDTRTPSARGQFFVFSTAGRPGNVTGRNRRTNRPAGREAAKRGRKLPAKQTGTT